MSANDRLTVLRFVAAFLWSDLDLDTHERAFFADFARELGVTSASDASLALMLVDGPPDPDVVDPTRVSAALAPAVREAALRAIAADGLVRPKEMALFDLLDELLPA